MKNAEPTRDSALYFQCGKETLGLLPEFFFYFIKKAFIDEDTTTVFAVDQALALLQVNVYLRWDNRKASATSATVCRYNGKAIAHI